MLINKGKETPVSMDVRTKEICDSIFLLICDNSEGEKKVIDCLNVIQTLITEYKQKIIE